MRLARVLAAMVISGLVVAAGMPLRAQEEYKWSVYSALNSVQGIAFDSAGTLWSATTGGVVGYSAARDSFIVYRTSEGLLNLNATAIGFDPAGGDMYVGGLDGSVSIRRSNGSWIYSTEITSKTELPSRRINGFGFSGDRVYILTDFGVGVYDARSSSFIESYQSLGPLQSNSAVYSIAFWKSGIYLGTSGGLVTASTSSPNLQVPTEWNKVPELGNRRINSLVVRGDSLLIGSDTAAFTYVAGGAPTERTDLPRTSILLAGNQVTAIATALNDNRIYRYRNGVFSGGPTTPDVIRAITLAPDGRSGVGLDRQGMAISEGDSLALKVPNAPVGNLFSDLTLSTDSAVWAASGSSSGGDGLSRLKDGIWSRFTAQNTPELRANRVWHVGAGANGSVWAGTFGAGATQITPKGVGFQAAYFDATNSPIRGKNATNEFPIVGKAVTDRNGRTWIVNFYNDETVSGPVLVLKLRDGEQGSQGTGWESFYTPNRVLRAYHLIAIDDNGTKWLGGDIGLIYINDRGTPSDPGDDDASIIRSTGGDNALQSDRQSALVIDRLGELWIGSEKGVVVLDNPVSVVNSKSKPHFRIIRPLADIPVSAIAVDALNRKWIGTNQGVFLFNPEGDSLIKTFTVATSPLVSNDIRSILSVDATGDIYIGTANGLNKVSTLAVESPKENGGITVFPQPFAVPSAEPLRIQGLPADANIKIYSVDMTLVREFQSPGGAVAVWDGLDNSGRVVASGIYIITAGANSGEDAVVGKIAVVRE